MLHIERLSTEIEALSQSTTEGRSQQAAQLEDARQWLAEAPSPDELRARLAHVAARDEGWHGALPTTDAPLDAYTYADDHPGPGVVLVGADGSQIYPDRHSAVLYYLIQVGGLIFRYDGSTPTPQQEATLHFKNEELYDELGLLISKSAIGMQREVREVAYLAALAESIRITDPTAPLFALTDGPLLWSYGERRKAESRAFFDYFCAMDRLRETRALPAGYIDRPGGRAVLDLLRASRLAPHDLPGKLDENPLHPLTDRDLMAQVLPPHARTSWFRRPTPTNRTHARHGHEIWFCYLNVGATTPIIARLEVPAWAVAGEGEEEASGIATLHAALRHQAHALQGYPYVLARAHEAALVTTQDKAALDQELQRRLMAQGIVPHESEKARQKSYLGRR